MPKITIDNSIFEPITVEISGKAYEVLEVSETEFDRIADLKTTTEQLAAFTGAPLKEIKGLPFRYTSAAVFRIMQAIVDSMAEMTGVKKKPLKKKPKR